MIRQSNKIIIDQEKFPSISNSNLNLNVSNSL